MKVVERKIKTKDFEVVKNKLKDLVNSHNFAVLAEHDFGAILKSKGKNLGKNAIVFDICNASKAHEILTISPIEGINLPCKIGIFEESNGYHVAYLDPKAIETNDESLKSIFKEISGVLEEISLKLSE
ncbi:DUF302 domain-containing protein [Athalassotoga saccharophila]|uniref:DUF302 domain-containing protein n=1 Tax=Athalassotoga saccharophila TaxID=1441386 RepID=UPI00137AF4FA|nr:DUF302 domain-containing protein [Athalassotoga saccharophila]BBJ28467.1 hypothetical protein ATHSA_1380 [Athalassotoga saccharophila]